MSVMEPIQSNKIDSELQYFNCCGKCAMCFWRAFKFVPVILILSCIVWAYYAYVYQLCLITVNSTAQACIYMAVFHVLLFMMLWSYFRTVFTEIRTVPDKFKLPNSELEKLLNADSEDAQRVILENYARDLPLVTRTNSGSVRYCNRCVLIKPDRAHHCSICAKCVLKMDHHCPWMNNCVCYFNYKFFMLFLGYALITCIFVMTTSMPYFIQFWKGEFGIVASAGRYHIVFAFFVSLMFGISLGSLFSYHCYLIINNRTTLESFRAPTFRGGPDKDGFSIGYMNNLKEVFGTRKNLWLLPVFTSCGDGIAFPLPNQEEDTESLLSTERWARWHDRPAYGDRPQSEDDYDDDDGDMFNF